MSSSNFYTYAYLRKKNNTPYYIGKGKDNRAFVKHKGISVPKDRSKIIFLKQNLTEEEAFKHEEYMIAVFGRKDLGTGILLNRTNGGDGTSGRVMSEEQKEKCKEVGNKHKENKTGFCGRSPEKMSEDGKKAAKASNSQKWKCTVTGYSSNAGGLTCYQKKRGIDPSNRIKVDGSRNWEITSENGKVVVTNCLKTWVKENDYSYDCLLKVREGKTKNHQGIIKVIPL
jgi:hypothetical protein